VRRSAIDGWRAAEPSTPQSRSGLRCSPSSGGPGDGRYLRPGSSSQLREIRAWLAAPRGAGSGAEPRGAERRPQLRRSQEQATESLPYSTVGASLLPRDRGMVTCPARELQIGIMSDSESSPSSPTSSASKRWATLQAFVRRSRSSSTISIECQVMYSSRCPATTSLVSGILQEGSPATASASSNPERSSSPSWDATGSR